MKSTRWILIVALGAFVATDCAKPPPPRKPKPPPDYDTEGWLNRHTFQVLTVGKPNESAKGFGRRRRQGEKNAILLAHKRTITMMADSLGSPDYQSPIDERFGGLIRNGKIMRRTYTVDDECAITYRVKSKNLKRQVKRVARKK